MNGVNNVNAAIRMLQEMQAMAGQARNESDDAVTATGQSGFAGALKSAIHQVNDMQQTAGAQADAFARGEDIPLTEVMVSMQQSRVAFEATKQVRNQLVEAYRDIFNMPV
ncbi:MAG: flagellar hook-basal body complex protein FliE [Ectothiorhodospiraceae bacterium]|nr:flagellar hook-basal body complex protein FliE [Ectothiorhodospiraceae bacterium]MCH8504017.1 flagellar hook-basal body complex protein FliE [Ectothiorhodospiraceae bacterium]